MRGLHAAATQFVVCLSCTPRTASQDAERCGPKCRPLHPQEVVGVRRSRLPQTPLLNMLLSLGSSWTHRLITAKDHASVQINVGNVDAATGRYTGDFKTYAICGYIRSKVRRTTLCVIPRAPADSSHRPFSERERHGVHSAYCRGRGCAGTEALNASRKTRSHLLSIGSRFFWGVDIMSARLQRSVAERPALSAVSVLGSWPNIDVLRCDGHARRSAASLSQME